MSKLHESVGIITSRTIINMYCELRAKSPNLAVWSEQHFAKNKSDQLQFRRFIAMLWAYGIPADPVGFTEGKFIWDGSERAKKIYESIVEAMPNFLKPSVDAAKFPLFFSRLLQKRFSVYRQYAYLGQLKERKSLASIAGLISWIRQYLKKRIDWLDANMEDMISSDGEEFTVVYLAETYGYPIADHQEEADVKVA